MIIQHFNVSIHVQANLSQGCTVTEVEPNEFILDTGNANLPGCYDHHYQSQYNSTAEMIYLKNSEIYARLSEIIQNPEHNEIKISLHESPDFDCITSLWLILQLLNPDFNGFWSNGIKTIVEYTSCVDTSLFKQTRDNLLSPATLLYISDHLASTTKHNNLDNCIHLGFKILDDFKSYAVANHFDEKIANAKDEDKIHIINSLSLDESHYVEELKLIQSDLQKYEFDKANACIEVEALPVVKKVNCKTSCVEKSLCSNLSASVTTTCRALLWLKVPSCRLHKNWARLDNYELTAIPCEVYDSETVSNGSFKYQEVNYPLTRVIISTVPTSNICLKNLAILLEKIECEKEALFFTSNPSVKRSRSHVRGGYETQSWVTNIDPWYDGKTYGYSIVDSPFSNSLLTIEEIMDVTLHYTEYGIQSSAYKVLYPFVYKDIHAFESICKDLQESSHNSLNGLKPLENTLKAYCNDCDTNYLRDHIKTYLFNCKQVSEKKNPAQVSWFGLNFSFNDTQLIHSSAELIIFNTGIGVVLTNHTYHHMNYEASYQTTSVTDVINNHIKSTKSPIEHLLVKIFNVHGYNSKIRMLPTRVHCNCSCNRIYYHYLRGDQHLVQSIINPLSRNSFFNHSLDAFMQSSNYTLGLSAASNILVDTAQESDEKASLQSLYFNQWFLIYLLTVHQTEALLNYKLLITQDPSVKHHYSIAFLRESFAKFSAQGVFTIATTDSLGTAIYNEWQKLLLVSGLKTEVQEQLLTLDEVNRQKFEKRISFISIFFLPLSIIFTLIQTVVAMISIHMAFKTGFIMLTASALVSVALMAILYVKDLKDN